MSMGGSEHSVLLVWVKDSLAPPMSPGPSANVGATVCFAGKETEARAVTWLFDLRYLVSKITKRQR
jgi:hypothetical protein